MVGGSLTMVIVFFVMAAPCMSQATVSSKLGFGAPGGGGAAGVDPLVVGGAGSAGAGPGTRHRRRASSNGEQHSEQLPRG